MYLIITKGQNFIDLNLLMWFQPIAEIENQIVKCCAKFT